MRSLLFVVLVATILTGLTPQRGLPPAYEAKDCNAPIHKDDYPNDEFTRKGGRTTTTRVRFENGLLTADNVEQGRDLNQYERLNLPEPKAGRNFENYDDPIPRARIFLWDHWHSQKLAYLTMTLIGVDSQSTAHIFVEKDERGKWRLAWRWVRHNNEIDDLPTSYGVEWVQPGGWRKPGIPLPPGEQPDPKKHELQFRDKCGDADHSL
jgi:hypothetical protein